MLVYGDALARVEHPVAASAEPGFWNIGEVSVRTDEVWSKALDYGFDFSNLGRGGRIRDRRHILGGLGALIVGEGCIGPKKIFTAIFCCFGCGSLGARRVTGTKTTDDYRASRDRIRGPWIWISEWEESLRSLYARAHRQTLGVHYSVQEFYRGEVKVVIGMGGWSLVLAGPHSHRTLLGYVNCAKDG